MLPQSLTFGDPRLPPRFWAKVNPNGPIPAHRPDLGPCWEWIGARSSGGYGQFHIGSRTDGSKRMVGAHRLAYEALVGPIPDGLESDHLCHNDSGCLGEPTCPHRACVNASHIEPVTSSVNHQRGITGGPRGEANGSAKLKATDIPIIAALRGKMRQTDIARWFGVRQRLISHIHCGESWTHIIRRGGEMNVPIERPNLRASN